jgi:cell division protein FtsB
MRDIGRRIRAHRLGRYARAEGPLRRRLGWIWAGLAAWLLWAGLISDHSFFQLWRAGRELESAKSELEDSRRRIRDLESELGDPRAREEQAERAIRLRGMARPGEIVYREQTKRGARPDSTNSGAR